MSKNTWAIGCVLTGIPCLPNGYQFIKQGEMVGFGWGLIVAGILFTSLGFYLFYRLSTTANKSVPAAPVPKASRNNKKRRKKSSRR